MADDIKTEYEREAKDGCAKAENNDEHGTEWRMWFANLMFGS